jgi:hypothetical protein
LLPQRSRLHDLLTFIVGAQDEMMIVAILIPRHSFEMQASRFENAST